MRRVVEAIDRDVGRRVKELVPVQGVCSCYEPVRLRAGLVMCEVYCDMLFMVVEHFRNGDPVPVYRRFRDEGRGMPEGLQYVSSWVAADLTRCYQVMEAEDRALLDQWIAFWSDVVAFEVFPVVSSDEARALVAPRL